MKLLKKKIKMPVKIAEAASWDSDYIDNFQLDEDMDWNVQLLDFPESEFYTSLEENSFFTQLTDLNNANTTGTTTTKQTTSLKYQIRNHDCMWSGRCVAHPEKTKCSYKHNNNINNSNNTNTQANLPTQQQQQQQQNINNNNNNNTNNNQNILTTTTTAANTTTITNTTPSVINKITSQQIPAGRSLLLNSRFNQNNVNIGSINNSKLMARLPNITTADFLKDRENNTTTIIRPDTPISLDDDPPEFKHTIDLAACTMGSNRMSLVNPEEVSSARIITMLKEHLEDSSNDSQQKDLRPFLTHKPDSLTDLLQDLQEITDFEAPDGDESNLDDDSSDSESSSGSVYTSSISETSRIATPQPSSKFEYQATHVGDHCYTRCKNRAEIIDYTRCKTRVNTDPLGVQTPSDSEEEIDVVSVGDKTLPTNPSARDRRALQTTVADKISARMVKTPRGIKTLPPRRQISDDSLLMSSCSSTPTKLNNNSLGGSPITVQCNDITTSSRKRTHPSSKETSMGSNKRHRGKKQRSPGKRQTSDTDEADTIEKRNLHNDMERQRRIGLKNLFEELKRQIPNIKDKERAPKVSILREAAALCTKLNREQEQANMLKKQQTRLMQKLKNLRTSLSTQWC